MISFYCSGSSFGKKDYVRNPGREREDKNGDKEDNDNYVVFKKITGKSKELVNGNDYGTYNLEDDSFKDKDLSVVIIFSNGKEKFAFAIDLKTREVGDYYG